MTLSEQIDAVYEEIKRINTTFSPNSIPHSDELIKSITNGLSIGEAGIPKLLKILVDANMIFSFEISKENINKNLPQISGYIVADLNIIQKLKNIFSAQLENLYEKKFRKKKMVHSIINELLPQAGQYNNSELGYTLNKASMLMEYDKLISNDYNQYTSNNQKQLLEKKIEEVNLNLYLNHSSDKSNNSESENKRATDSEEADILNNDKRKSLASVIKIYGVDFFFRVNLRKYNFRLLMDVVTTQNILKKSHLQTLKEMIKKMSDNYDKDNKLREHQGEINELNRIISRYLIISTDNSSSKN